jgi:uncharacterized membrane protein YbjE (DUF340 family)
MSTKSKPINYRTIGMLIGLALGYPISYSFQPGLFKMVVSLGDYVANIGDVFQEQALLRCVLITMLVCVIIGALIGQVINNILSTKTQ